MGIPEKDFWERFHRLNDEWEIGKIDGFTELLKRLCEESGRDDSASVINELVSERSTQLVGFFDIDPEILKMVREIKSMGLQIGLVTNVSNLDFAGWYKTDLASLFDHATTSFEVGVAKPDPVIYERCLEALGVEAAEAIYVGDGGNDELAGADRVGMTPLWATWFLDQWPYGIRPGARFEGDEWRQFPGHPPPFPRIETPRKLVDRLRTGE